MSSPRAVALTLAVVTFACVELAAARVYRASFATHPAFVTGVAVALAACAVAWLLGPRWASVLEGAFARWLGVGVVASGGYATWFRATQIRGNLADGPIVPLLVGATAGLVLVSYAVARSKVSVLLVGAVVTGLALRGVEMLAVRINPRTADMIPLVVLSLRSLLAGETPYRLYQMPWDVPLTYLPLNWLAYLPAYAAGIDLRWTNAMAELSILGALFFASRRSRREDATRHEAATTLWAAWFVSHSLVTYDATVAAAVQWAALAWTAAFAVTLARRAPVVIGVALATTPLVLPLVLPILFAWRRRKLVASAIAIAVASALVLPWLAIGPRGFVDGVVLWFNDLDRYPRHMWLTARAWCLFPGFACALWSAGLERLLKPLQLAFVLGIGLRAYWRAAGSRPVRYAIAGDLVAAYAAFMLVNPVVWNYLWEPVRVLALVALASSWSVTPKTMSASPR